MRLARSLSLLALLALCACGSDDPPAKQRLGWHEFRDVLRTARTAEFETFDEAAPAIIVGLIAGLEQQLAIIAGDNLMLRQLLAPVPADAPPIALEAVPAPMPERLIERLQVLAEKAMPLLTMDTTGNVRKRMTEMVSNAVRESLSHAVESQVSPMRDELASYLPPVEWPLQTPQPPDLYAWMRIMQRRPLSKADAWDVEMGDRLGHPKAGWTDGEGPVPIVQARMLHDIFKVPDMLWSLIVLIKYGKPQRYADPDFRQMVQETRAGIIELATSRLRQTWHDSIIHIDRYLHSEYDRNLHRKTAKPAGAASHRQASMDAHGPVIELIEPSLTRAFEDTVQGDAAQTIRVVVEVADPSGIRDVVIGGMAADDIGEHRFARSVVLTPASTELRITATDVHGNTGVRAIKVGWREGKAALESSRQGRDYALVVGIDTYENAPDLNNAVRDAKEIARVLEDEFGFQVDLRPNLTKEGLQDAITEYQGRTFANDDQLFVYYAGHGIYDGPPRHRGCLMLKDSLSPRDDRHRNSYLAHNLFLEDVSGIKCKHILLMLDACYGGSAFKSEVDNKRATPTMTNEAIEDLIRRKMKLRTRKMITSGQLEEVSDGVPGKHSPFAAQLLEILTGNQPLLTFAQLVGGLQATRPSTLGGSLRHHSDAGGSDFLFIRRR